MKRKIIVIGGGFAGLQFVKHVDGNLFDLMLIDKLNHHQFQPLFYQVATSQLEPSSISFPLRKIFQHKKNLQIRLAEVTEIVSSENKLRTDIGDFQYDDLVVATGCDTNYFNQNNIKENALALKSTYDAISIRNKVLQNFEDMLSADASEREKLLNIVIAGGGPTGVELAGAFAELKKNILPKDYPGIDFSAMNIYLIEGSAHTLSAMSENAQRASEKYLKELGVTLKLNVRVTDFVNDVVMLNDNTQISSRNLIWAAGVKGNVMSGIATQSIHKTGRFIVDRFNRVKDYENIYAIGDIAYMETPLYKNAHPQLANVAINQAKNLAKNFKRKIQNKALKEFEYRDLGSMATVGKHKAVVDLPFIRFSGFIAWFIWMFLHLMLILSVRNKIIIFINWAWTYISKDSSLRLILAKRKSK